MLVDGRYVSVHFSSVLHSMRSRLLHTGWMADGKCHGDVADLHSAYLHRWMLPSAVHPAAVTASGHKKAAALGNATVNSQDQPHFVNSQRTKDIWLTTDIWLSLAASEARASHNCLPTGHTALSDYDRQVLKKVVSHMTD